MNLNFLRIFIIITLIAAILLLLIVGALQLTLPSVAWLFPALETSFFDLGVLGAYRYKSYVSFNLTSPLLTTPIWDDSCDDGSYVLLTPKGDAVPHAGPVIIDTRGNLVWMSNKFNDSMNLNVQQFNGKNYLTMWSGFKIGSQGKGVYYLLDSSYSIAHTIRAVGPGVDADIHEFKLSRDGTAMFTVYNTTSTDLSSIGRPHTGWVEDSVFQEVNVETNELLFEWRASQHTDPSDTFMTNPIGGYFSKWPFDIFHINSIDKDSKGNYLISSRHFHSVTCIDPDGETVWQLGGVKNEFHDVNTGKGPTFMWQHDARWVQEPNGQGVGLISLFDNMEGGVLHADGPYSRGVLLEISIPNKTFSMLHEYIAYSHTRAPSQGSMQVLPNGNVFIGWGHSAEFSEFRADGSLLCEWHFGPSLLDFFGHAVSYRAAKIAKKDWTGLPNTNPTAKEKRWKIYVSWNGATEVAAWKLQVTRHTDALGEDVWEDLAVVERNNQFESVFKLPTMAGSKRYRVAALDAQKKVIRYSDVLEVDWTKRIFQIFATVLLWVGFAVGACVFWTKWRKHIKRRGLGWNGAWEYRRP